MSNEHGKKIKELIRDLKKWPDRPNEFFLERHDGLNLNKNSLKILRKNIKKEQFSKQDLIEFYDSVYPKEEFEKLYNLKKFTLTEIDTAFLSECAKVCEFYKKNTEMSIEEIELEFPDLKKYNSTAIRNLIKNPIKNWKILVVGFHIKEKYKNNSEKKNHKIAGLTYWYEGQREMIKKQIDEERKKNW